MGIFTTCAAMAACCCCGTVCGGCFRCCDGAGKTSGKKAKKFYLFLQFLAVVFAIVMRYWGGGEIDLYAWTVGCDEGNDVSIGCRGNAAVYRISFMQGIFFLVMAFGSWWSSDFHVTHACSKILLWLSLMVASFFIPNYVFDGSGYAWFSRVVSVFFLLVQIVILIDFAYRWNDSWLESADERGRELQTDSFNKWHYGMLGFAFALYVGWLTAVVCMYKYFNDCSLDSFFISMALILPLAGLLLALYTVAPLLPSAVIASYAAFLCWGAISANPDAACAAAQQNVDKQSPAIIAFGIIFAAVTLVWVSMSTAESVKTMELEFQTEKKKKDPKAQTFIDNQSGPPVAAAQNPTAQPAEGDVELGEGGGAGDAQGDASAIETKDVRVTAADKARMARLQEDEDRRRDDPASRQEQQDRLDAADAEKYWIFHLVMFFGAVYLAMLLTDWGANPDPSADDDVAAAAVGTTGAPVNSDWLPPPNAGKTAMWVKALSGWTACSLYIWTLVAPICLPNRDWD